MKVVLEAGSEITFKAGGSFVKIDPSGITLVGPSVKMNSGGSPGSGTGAAPLLPEEVTPQQAGKVASAPLLPTHGGLLVQAQKQALQHAAAQAQPFCAVCSQAEQKQ